MIPRKYIKAFIAACSVLLITLTVRFIVLPLYHSNDVQKDMAGRQDFVRSYAASDLVNTPTPWQVYKPKIYLETYTKYSGEPIDELRLYGWMYPPLYSFLIHFLSDLPLKAAFTAYVVFQIAIFFLAGYRFIWFTAFDAILFCSTAMLCSLSRGQNGVLIATFYIAAFRYIKILPWLSGFFFACAACKPQLGLLVPVLLLSGRFYKVMISASITLISVSVLSVLVYGFQSWRAYFHSFMAGLSSNELNLNSTQTESMLGSIISSYHMPVIYNFFNSMGLSSRISGVLQLGFIAYGFYRAACIARNEKMTDSLNMMVQFSLLSSLVSPYFNIYDYVLAVSAVLACMLTVNRNAHISMAGIIVILLVNNLPVINNMSHIVLVPAIVWLAYEYMRRDNQKTIQDRQEILNPL